MIFLFGRRKRKSRIVAANNPTGSPRLRYIGPREGTAGTVYDPKRMRRWQDMPEESRFTDAKAPDLKEIGSSYEAKELLAHIRAMGKTPEGVISHNRATQIAKAIRLLEEIKGAESDIHHAEGTLSLGYFRETTAERGFPTTVRGKPSARFPRVWWAGETPRYIPLSKKIPGDVPRIFSRIPAFGSLIGVKIDQALSGVFNIFSRYRRETYRQNTEADMPEILKILNDKKAEYNSVMSGITDEELEMYASNLGFYVRGKGQKKIAA